MPVLCGYLKKKGDYGVYYCYLSDTMFELRGNWHGYYDWGGAFTLSGTNLMSHVYNHLEAEIRAQMLLEEGPQVL